MPSMAAAIFRSRHRPEPAQAKAEYGWENGQ